MDGQLIPIDKFNLSWEQLLPGASESQYSPEYDYVQGWQGTLKTFKNLKNLKKTIVGKQPWKRREKQANFRVFKDFKVLYLDLNT